MAADSNGTWLLPVALIFVIAAGAWVVQSQSAEPDGLSALGPSQPAGDPTESSSDAGIEAHEPVTDSLKDDNRDRSVVELPVERLSPESVESPPTGNPALNRLLEDWRVKLVDGERFKIESDRLMRENRISAARMILTEHIAIELEEKGGGASPSEGGQRIAEGETYRFSKDGRMYFFNDGDYPLWDESVLYTDDPLLEVSSTFFAEILGVADVVRTKIVGAEGN